MKIYELCYELYKIDWMKRISAERQADALKNWFEETDDKNEYTFDSFISEHGYDGELYVCFDEFLDNEYLDREYIEALLDNDCLYEMYAEDLDGKILSGKMLSHKVVR